MNEWCPNLSFLWPHLTNLSCLVTSWERLLLHRINHPIINAIVFSCMSNSCVRPDTATLMLMSLLHPLVHVTQCYYERVCHDGWLFLLLFCGYRGGQPIAFDLLISEVVSRAWEWGGGTEDAVAKCDQSTPCITADQIFLHVWNLNNSLTHNPLGGIFFNWIMKIDCYWSFKTMYMPGYMHLYI